MFPPTTPTTERIRIESEMRELERRAIRAAREAYATPRRPLLRWSPLASLSQFGQSLATLTRTLVRKPQTEPPACCPE